jgi:hypothetical protein
MYIQIMTMSRQHRYLNRYMFIMTYNTWSVFECRSDNYGCIYHRLFILQEMRPGRSDQSGLRFISGIICKSKALKFERMLFRATRGNMLFNQAPADEEIMDPVSCEMVIFLLNTVDCFENCCSPWFCYLQKMSFHFLVLGFLHPCPFLHELIDFIPFRKKWLNHLVEPY